MVLLIAGPPVEVGVTMYVLSISSVSEVLMVQFAFKLIQNSTATIARSFISFQSREQPRALSLFPFPTSLVSIVSKKSDSGNVHFRPTQPFHVGDGTIDRNAKIVSIPL